LMSNLKESILGLLTALSGVFVYLIFARKKESTR